MPAASVLFDERSTTGNTQLTFLIPAHDDNATAAVHVLVAGDATPATAPPSGWVEQTAAYQAAADVTVITWTNDAGLPEAEETVTVAWTGTARAAGVLAVSSNTTGLSQVGAVDSNSTYDSAGDHAGVTAAEDDEYLLVFGGTADVGGERYPITAAPGSLTDVVRTEAVSAGIDAWVIHSPDGIGTGATGAISYTLTGTGVASDPAVLGREGFATFGSGDANNAGAAVDVTWPATPELGWSALIAATGQPPDVTATTPAVDATATADTAGVASTTVTVTLPAGHAAKTCVLELVVEGNAGTVTTPAGFTTGPAVVGIVHTATKQLDATETDVTWTCTTARPLAVRAYIVDGTITGTHVTHTLANTAHPYGPHGSPQQTSDAASLHLLTWTATTDTAVASSTTDAHTITTHTQPAGHAYETGYGTDVPGAAGVNPSGTTTMSTATDAVTVSYIIDPRPQNPTNIDAPAGWDVVWSKAGAGDVPSQYVFSKVLDQTDIDDGQVTVTPTGGVGEFNGVIALYSGGDTSTIIETAAASDGPAYATATSSPAVATTSINACEVVIVFAADHGAPSHADSLVSAATIGAGPTQQAAVADPAGSAIWWFDIDRSTADAGTARVGTITNGLANEVNHETVAFALKPAAGNGSRQTTQAVTFAAAVDAGPSIVWAAPTDCVTDPATINGSASDTEGVGTVTVEIRRNSDNQYWDGATWTGTPTSVTATLGTPGGTTTTWTYTATGAFVNPGQYQVTVAATDQGTPTATRTRVNTYCVAGATAVAIKREARIGCDPTGITVEVIGRHGGVAPNAIVARLPILSTTGFFDRRLDSPSEAEVECRLSPLDLQRCCPDFADIDTWANLLRITWEGIEAWVGPITFVRHFTDGIFLKAHDLSIHWQTRVLGEHHHEAVDLATIFADYHRDAYNQDPWGVDVVAQPVGLTGTRDVLATDGMVAWSAISELTRTGLDYTVVGRTMIVGGEEVPAAPITTLRDDHFTEPLTVVDDGVVRATDYVVSGGDQITGRAALPETSDVRRRYGLITGRSQERNILDELSAGRAAKTRLDFMQDSIRVEPPTHAYLAPSAPIQLVDLIPGARIDINSAATCRPVAGQFRLSRVTARMDGRVAISLQPLGTVGA